MHSYVMEEIARCRERELRSSASRRTLLRGLASERILGGSA